MPKDPISSLKTEIVRTLEKLENAQTQELRAVRRQFSKRVASMPGTDVQKLALLLRQTNIPDFFAFELLHHHKDAMGEMTAEMLEKLGKGINNWVAVDTFACFVAGPAWREKRVSDQLIQKWARSQDRWWRRAALVSTVPLNNKTRGGRGDAERTLKICEMLTQDRDDMVIKALSWSLRELSKREAVPVTLFVAKHSNELNSRVLREVKNKLVTGLKNPR